MSKTPTDFSNARSLREIWQQAAQLYGSRVALRDPHSKPEVSLTFDQFYDQLLRFGAGLRSLGVQPGDRVALISDNCPRWMIADQGILALGAADATRSPQADREELLYILEHSGSNTLVIETLAALKKLQPEVGKLPIERTILLSDETPPEGILNFKQVLEKGDNRDIGAVEITPDTLATLIYTSGTTGKPKGVMLSHGNLLHQVTTFGTVLRPEVGANILSILPTWHSYERACEYFLLSCGCTQIYTSIRHIKADLKQYKPNYMVAVPRIWETIYEGAQKNLREQTGAKGRLVQTLLQAGQNYLLNRRIADNMSLEHLNASAATRALAGLRAASLWPLYALGERLVYGKIREATGGNLDWVISGGGSLAPHLDLFFEQVGIEILVGYGLTETSPVLTVRRPDHNLRGSAGRPLPKTEIKIVDLDSRQPLPAEQQGLVLARGPQVMQGYYRDPEATNKAIDPQGWFDTGDLGWLSPDGDLVLTGRAKDTIVLTNGENIEPQPIEDACLRSPYIEQIMLVGQDQKMLGALIVPNREALAQWAITQGITPAEPEQLDLSKKPFYELIQSELKREVKNRPGYRADDRIGPVRFLSEAFTQENGMLTQTLKVRRPVVAQRYRDMISEMFD
ncbi:long-chain fatty acid--CoA ligase [Leptolyngbya sp. FACHB-261]|uniref:AMP-dependent synthetase/ligase n=1 Tax=Leptolyngbya sp. FACHB-261 TaxID=2692806 RepID=UPI0018EF51AD|nr:long-chain fatty acid--CoA ligase [Leptolyngbya sp. FACHB-261]